SFGGLLIATLIWRGVGMAAALALMAAGGLFLTHELSALNLTTNRQISSIDQAFDGAGSRAPTHPGPLIIHIPPPDSGPPLPGGPITWVRTQLAAPHYSRQMVDG